MCTVTYIPTQDGFYLTSNRDEHCNRGSALSPSVYQDMLYPKDPDMSGSWIAAKANGDMAVLLNGAFVKHFAQPPYRISRGVLLLNVLAASKPLAYFNSVDLNNIEPFTLIICMNGMLYECRWDGTAKYTLPLDQHSSHIWSSATLYDETAQTVKKDRFKSTILSDSRSIINFHQTERLAGTIGTVSITHVKIVFGQAIIMTYDDLKSTTMQVQHLAITTSQIPWLSLRIFMVKLFNWEYWPYYMIYIPVMFYWFWLSLKSRAIFFFNTANPGMKNGGFAMDSKNDIYAHIPAQYCPQTILVKAGYSIENPGIKLPLIAKPDIGQRGLQVKLLQSKQDLADYATNSKVDFLLQEYISHPYEAGIFYFSRPGSRTGTITGVVGKELMMVTGDGKATLQELLAANPRYLLQIPALKKAYGLALQKVLPYGEACLPAPYGNHSRGAKFIDLSPQVTSELVKNIHAVCAQIPGFYYGRLDVKYDSWAELCAGKFKIIEVNGAASEPAHMYDPKHSIFFAWKEIIRHWAILYHISKLNRKKRGLAHMTYRQGMDMIKNNTQYVNLTIS
ncbi:NRDE family protein [Mucilaginibacter terrae]|uniref:NRDE family protein n=1 Tax=Mucilaginibacter terrae TaxID=1955052 RepID=UPI0036454D4B